MALTPAAAGALEKLEATLTPGLSSILMRARNHGDLGRSSPALRKINRKKKLER